MLTSHCDRWLHAIAPDPGDEATLRGRGVPAGFIRHALDIDEPARIEHDPAGATLIVLRVPDGDAGAGRATSLSIVVLPDTVVTIASHRLGFLETAPPHLAGDAMPAAILPEVIHAVASAFGVRLDRIDDTVERLEQSLKTSLRNEEVLGLLECQKALVHLERAIAADELMLVRLRDDPTLAFDQAARRRLDDALVEVRQAMQMATISAEILASMMDAFASIISNNLNHVMKVLAALTIILAIPTMVSGLLGMNVPIPGGHTPWAFAAVVAMIAVSSVLLAVVFRRRRWL